MAVKAPKASTNGTGAEDVAMVEISQVAAETIVVPVVGTSPLIVHRFSEKAKRQMLDNMQGRKTPKEVKDPEAEYEASFYRLDDGSYGFPVTAFKEATTSAARFYGKNLVTMVGLRQSMFFKGETGVSGEPLVRLTTSDPVMREDVVRVGRGGTDLRYRPMFTEWSADLTVTFVKTLLTRDSVLSLIDAGGLGTGVGEWRPEKSGIYGTYKVDTDRQIEVLER